MIERQLLKGSLKSIVLKQLKKNGRMYGYEITQRILEESKGKIQLTFGALYPVLHKLEDEKDVETEQEIVNNRTRVYYKLTKKGINTTTEKVKELEEFIETLQLLIKPNYTYAKM